MPRMPLKRKKPTTGTRGSDSFPRKRVALSPVQDRQHHQGDSPQDTVDDRSHPEPMDTDHPANPLKRACEEGSPKSIIAEENMPDLLLPQLPDAQLPDLDHPVSPQLKVDEEDKSITVEGQLPGSQLPGSQLPGSQLPGNMPDLLIAQLPDAQLLDTQQPDTQLPEAQLRDPSHPVNPQLKVDEEDKSITAEENMPKPIIAQSPDTEELEKRRLEELVKSDLHASLTEWVSQKEFWKPFPDPEQNDRWVDDRIFAVCAYTNIEGCWDCLSIDVSRFVYLAFPQEGVSWDSLNADTQNRISKWAGNKGKEYIEGGSLAHEPETLLVSWIWRILYDNLLSPACTDKWFGESWAAYGKLRSELREQITDVDNSFTRSYHNWRYTSARMLSMLHGPHTDPERLKRIIKDEVGQLIQVDRAGSERVYDTLDELVETAVTLDFLVEVVKKNISFEMHHPETRELSGFIYKEGDARMEVQLSDPDLVDGRPVDFIRRPAMRQYGKVRSETVPLFGIANHPGEFLYKDYHQCTESCPMVVVVKEKERNEA